MADTKQKGGGTDIKPMAAKPDPAVTSPTATQAVGIDIKPPIASLNTHPSPGTPPATTPGTPAASSDYASAGLSSNDTVIGVAIVLALALLFFFLRGGLRSHLIAMRASPSAAGNAGWSLFAFLLALSVTVVFGLLGNLWQVLAFLIPMGALTLVTLAVFAVLYNAAARGRR